MKERIESSRTDPVAVLAKLLNQPKAIDWFFRGVMKDVKLDEACEGAAYHERMEVGRLIFPDDSSLGDSNSPGGKDITTPRSNHNLIT